MVEHFLIFFCVVGRTKMFPRTILQYQPASDRFAWLQVHAVPIALEMPLVMLPKIPGSGIKPDTSLSTKNQNVCQKENGERKQSECLSATF